MIHDTLTGFTVRVEPHLAGCKNAVLSGGTLFVSPAMYDLITHATEAELERLLAAIHCVRIPLLTSFLDMSLELQTVDQRW